MLERITQINNPEFCVSMLSLRYLELWVPPLFFQLLCHGLHSIIIEKLFSEFPLELIYDCELNMIWSERGGLVGVLVWNERTKRNEKFLKCNSRTRMQFLEKFRQNFLFDKFQFLKGFGTHNRIMLILITLFYKYYK